MSNLLQKWHTISWPIQQSELRKFCTMALLMLLILLNQNLIRGIKDSMVVTLIGPEVLSFIKLFVEMPAGFLFVLIYSILCNKMSPENIFRVIILFFLAFFIAFNFFLFPYQDVLHPNPDLIYNYVQLYPHLKWFFMMWGKWTLVCFYVMGELWPMIIFTLLYWQLANKVTTTEEAGRFYFYFNLVGQANLLIYRDLIIYLSHKGHFLLSLLGMRTTHKLTPLMLVVSLLCIFILLLHKYIETYVIGRQVVQAGATKEVKLAPSLWKSFKLITCSKYLMLICALTISYSMTINLIEGLWFYEANLFYSNDDTSLRIYQGKVSYWTGIVTLICALLGNVVMQKLGWLGAALITPIMTWVMGGCFFLFVIAHHFNCLPDRLIGIATLAVIVAMGALQNVLAKGTKYCFFDTTKEMTYIPLDKEMQTKGKAAVDILGGKIGKSAGSIVQVICYMIFATKQPDQLAPFLMVLFYLICAIWTIATCILSKRYHQLVTKTDCQPC